MSHGINNRIPFFSICLLFVFALSLQLGCDDNNYRSSGRSTKQLRLENEQAEKEFDAELQARIDQTEAMFEPYRNNGLVKVKLAPSDGVIYIDNGLVTIPKKGLMLPVGTYDIKAVWPDGKQTIKKVFVTPALQQIISYDWNFSRNTNGGSGNEKAHISFNAPLSPTEVALVSPK
jgi:hypothetical protein